MEALVNFTEIPIIKQLLMLDVIFYGMGIANILAGNKPSSTRRIQAYAPQTTSHFIQRFLHNNQAEKRIVTSSFGQFICLFYIKSLNVELDIRFDTRSFDICANQCTVNVEKLYLGRNGLSALAAIDECSPFTELLQSCLQRRCKLLMKTPMHLNVYDKIRDLYKNGWTIDNMSIKIVSLETPSKCPICHETICGEVVQTVCHHYFCMECWEQHWKHSVGDLSEDNIFRFNLAGHPVEVNCPMCRHSMHSWECAPLREMTSSS